MANQKVPVKHYQRLSKLFPEAISALENLGSAIHNSGPIRGKTAELIQLAGAAAVQSEGSVHSHTRRAALLNIQLLELHNRHIRKSPESRCRSFLLHSQPISFSDISEPR